MIFFWILNSLYFKWFNSARFDDLLAGCPMTPGEGSQFILAKKKYSTRGGVFFLGAAKGNRTPIPSLARRSSTIEPWPRNCLLFYLFFQLFGTRHSPLLSRVVAVPRI